MRRGLLLALLVPGLYLTGCAGSGVGYSFYAPVGPPPIRSERVGVSPGPGYVWIKGYWSYARGGYSWVPGQWERPPRARSAWVEGRWEHRGDRWAYREGHWR